MTVRVLNPWHRLLWLIFLPVTVSGSSHAFERFEFRRLEMGTIFRVVLYTDHAHRASLAAGAAFERIEELERILSDFREDSELNLAVRDAFDRPVILGFDLTRVLERSLDYARITGGAYDPTVKPLIDLWRESRGTGSLPAAERLNAARQKVGFGNVLLNQRLHSLRFRVEGIELDLGGIAKGYAADEALRALLDHGVSRALVDAGGDIRLGAAPPGRDAWLIELGTPGGNSLSMRLVERAVATSGDTYQFTEIEGVRYSHIVDPRTGMGLVRHCQVTVVAQTSMQADALATAFSVLAPHEALQLAEGLEGVGVRISCSDRQGEKAFVSKKFPP